MDFSGFKTSEEQPLHLQLREWILGQLAAYPLEAKLPTDRQLARELRVAPMTINRVMGDLERDGYVVRRQGKGTFLASRERRVHAERSRTPPNGEIVLAYPNYFSHEYWARTLAAEELSLKAGCALVEFKMNPDTTYRALLEMIRQHPRVRGILIAPVPGTIDRQVFGELDALGLPIVVFSHCDYLSLGSHVYAVVPDWYKSGYLRVQYLLERGHQEIGYVACEPAGQDGGDALKGMYQCLRDFGLGTRSLRRAQRGTRPWTNSALAAIDLCDELLGEHELTALMTDSENGALGCLQALWRRHLSVPGQVSLIGYGANPEVALCCPPLTMVEPSYYEEMNTAISLLYQHEPGNTGRLVKVDVRVNERQSVVPLAVPPAGRTRLRPAVSRPTLSPYQIR